jgi:hypothetical protein
MTSAPPFLNRVSAGVRKELLRASPEVLARAQEFLSRAGRPCVYFDSVRAADAPLRRGPIGRLLQKPVAAPRLPVLQSKFGGVPYLTAGEVPLMKDRRFLLQINLAEVPELPAPLPRTGLFCVDMVSSAPYYRWFGIRFHPDPAEALAAPPAGQVDSVGDYEASLRFMPGASYSSADWESVFADQDHRLQDAWSDCEYGIDNVTGGRPSSTREEPHRLGGYRTSVLEEDTFRPPDGYPPDIREYELLLRLPFDNTAGFGWGSNVPYILIHRDDLAAGRLERAFDAPANC